MGKECGARLCRRLWGGSNTSPLKTTTCSPVWWILYLVTVSCKGPIWGRGRGGARGVGLSVGYKMHLRISCSPKKIR